MATALRAPLNIPAALALPVHVNGPSAELNRLIGSSNFQTVIHCKENQWVGGDESGRLFVVQSVFAKSIYYLTSIVCLCQTGRAAGRILSQISRNLSNAFKNGCTQPVDADSDFRRTYEPSLQRWASAVQRLKPKYGADEETIEEIYDLAFHPEVIEPQIAYQLRGIRPKTMGENGGINGTYLLRNRLSQPCAIFKPAEQEAGMKGNPNVDPSLFMRGIGRWTEIPPGTSYQREQAAYLLDQDHFMGIPRTTVVKLPRELFEQISCIRRIVRFIFRNQKMVGSLQKFMPTCKPLAEHHSTTQQILPRIISIPLYVFSSVQGNRIGAREIHKLAIFDIRSLNADRHLHNCLTDDHLRIQPIDHGYTFPEKANILRFFWMNFFQSRSAFDREELDYIRKIDPEKDCALIHAKVPSLSRKGLFRVKVAGNLLKEAAARGLNAFQIGELMIGVRDYSQRFESPSDIGKPSYFEVKIVRPLLTGQYEEKAFLNQEISAYLKGTRKEVSDVE